MNFPVSKDWTNFRIREVVDINPPGERINLVAEAPVAYLIGGKAKAVNLQYRPLHEVEDTSKYVKTGDIVLNQIFSAKDGMEMFVVPSLTAGFGYVPNDYIVLRTKGVESRWLYHFLQQDSLKESLIRYHIGAGRSRISLKYLSEISIPSPIRSIQIRILEQLQAIEHIKELRIKANQLMDTVFPGYVNQLMNKYDFVEFGNLVNIQKGKYSPFLEKESEDEYGVPFVQAADLRYSEIWKTLRSVNSEYYDNRVMVDPDTVLIPSSRSKGYKQKVSLLKMKALIGPSVYAIEPKSSFQGMTSKFLWAYLKYSNMLKPFTQEKGAITLQELRELPFPCLNHETYQIADDLLKEIAARHELARSQVTLINKFYQLVLYQIFGEIKENSSNQPLVEEVQDRSSLYKPYMSQEQIVIYTLIQQIPDTRFSAEQIVRRADEIRIRLQRTAILDTLKIFEILGLVIQTKSGKTSSWRLVSEEDMLEVTGEIKAALD
ncbi:MAG: hypothetical protein K0Q73_6774 [Paenibacillus sp.]|nr:hypothetical protein [Paenibacillus sp.]